MTWYRVKNGGNTWHVRRSCVSLRRVPDEHILPSIGGPPDPNPACYCANCVRFDPFARASRR